MLTYQQRRQARDELRERLSKNRFTHFITLSANDPDASAAKMRRLLKEWDARINRFLIGTHWQRKPDDRLLWFAFLEKPNVHPHWHILAEVDPGIAASEVGEGRVQDFPLIAEREWRILCRSGSVVVYPFDHKATPYSTKSLAQDDLLEHFVSHLEFVRN